MTIPARPASFGPTSSDNPLDTLSTRIQSQSPHLSHSTSLSSHRKGNRPSPTPSTRTSSMPGSGSPGVSRHPSTSMMNGSPNGTPNGENGSPRQRRKPVPSIVVPSYTPSPSQTHAEQLPASHPFAMAHPSPRGWEREKQAQSQSNGQAVQISPKPSGSPASTVASEVDTPGFREDKDLFYRAPISGPDGSMPSLPMAAPRSGGPLPPPRSTVHKRQPSGQVKQDTNSSLTEQGPTTSGAGVHGNDTSDGPASGERRGTFHGGLNIIIPSDAFTSLDEARIQLESTNLAQREYSGNDADSFSSTPSMPTTPVGHPSPRTAHDAGSPNYSPLPADAAYYNRSLPALPNNASTTSLGMMSILGVGPPGSPNAKTTATVNGARNDSVDSRMTNLSSPPSPVDMGRSTTSLGMFSILESGPAGVKEKEKKDKSARRKGNQAEMGTLEEKNTPKLAVYSESLATGKEKRGRLSFLSKATRRNGGARETNSLPMSPVEEDEEEDEEENGFNISRPPNRRKLWEAGESFVRDEEGNMVRFGDFFPTWDGDSSIMPTAITKAQAAEAIKSAALSSGTPGQTTKDRFNRDIASANAAGSIRSFSPVFPASPAGARSANGSTSATSRHSTDFVRGHAAKPSTSSHPLSQAHTPVLGQGEGETTEPRPQPKTVVFFIRTFWCGQCQDYTLASLSLLDHDALRRSNMRVVIISNGNWRHIKPYRKLFKCPFPIYVDASRNLYRQMGMTRSTIRTGPWFSGRAAYNVKSIPMQWGQSMVSAVKLPKRNPGNLFQLGGEFIIEPGYDCTFAHRMTNFSNHMEAPDVLRIAGCDESDLVDTSRGPVQLDEVQLAEAARLEAEMREWRDAAGAKDGEATNGFDSVEVSNTAKRSDSLEVDSEQHDQFYTPVGSTAAFGLPTSAQSATVKPTSLENMLPGGDRRQSTASALSLNTAERDRLDGLEVVVQDEEVEPDLELKADEATLERRYQEAMRLDDQARRAALDKL